MSAGRAGSRGGRKQDVFSERNLSTSLNPLFRFKPLKSFNFCHFVKLQFLGLGTGPTITHMTHERARSCWALVALI